MLGAGCRDLSSLTLADNESCSVRNGWPLWLLLLLQGMGHAKAAGRIGEGRSSCARVKRGAGTAGVAVEEEKCTMNLFPVYDKNTLKQIFILIKNIHIKGA